MSSCRCSSAMSGPMSGSVGGPMSSPCILIKFHQVNWKVIHGYTSCM